VRHARSLSWLLVAAGAAARIVQVALDAPLRHDEAALSLSLIGRDFAAVAEPLAHQQAAPPGFLLAQIAATRAFGAGELALRLVPLVCGLLALVWFRGAALRLLPAPAALLALALVAINDEAIYHSGDAKQYSGDFAATAGLLLLAAKLGEPPFPSRRLAAWAFAGAAALLVSHPSCFVLGAIGTSWLARAWRRRDRLALRDAIGLAASWSIVFAASFAFSRDLADTAGLVDWWSRSFPPLPPTSAEEWGWYLREPLKLFREPAGLQPFVLAAALFVAGIVVARRRGSPLGSIGWTPLVFAFGAAALRLYPFHARFLLFFVPIVALLVAQGWLAAWDFAARARRPWSVAARAAVTAALLFVPLANFLPCFVRHYLKGNDLRAPLAAVAAEARPGDVLLAEDPLDPPLEYYWRRFELERKGVERRDLDRFVAGLAGASVDGAALAPPASSSGRIWVGMRFESKRERLFFRERVSAKVAEQRRRNAERLDLVGRGARPARLVSSREFNGYELHLLEVE
jgi:hypothetical protein